MMDDASLEQLSREDLIPLVRSLQAQVKALQAEIETLKRAQHRPAAPFSKGRHKPDPKPPGRKKGPGPFTYRKPPKPEERTEPPIDVPVTRTECPACGGPLVEEGTDSAYLTDLPEVIRPSVREYRVSVCRCAACGAKFAVSPPTWRTTSGAPPPIGWGRE